MGCVSWQRPSPVACCGMRSLSGWITSVSKILHVACTVLHSDDHDVPKKIATHAMNTSHAIRHR